MFFDKRATIGEKRIVTRFYPTWAGNGDDIRKGLHRVVQEFKIVVGYDGAHPEWVTVGWADNED
jgi:hypothetical protein